jgi:molecular chaperone DnaJ
VRGRGIPHRLRAGKGDQLVEVAIEVPSRLTPRARELLEELGEELGEELLPQRKSFVEKLKDLFG